MKSTVEKIKINVEDLMNNGLDVHPDYSHGYNDGSPTMSAESPQDTNNFEDAVNCDTESPQNGEPVGIKVLVLSDSRNLSYDATYLKDPIEWCVVKPLYNILHITEKENEDLIAQCDVVLISSGINDIVKWNYGGKDIARFLTN